jgi:hypothetical protein
MDVLQRISSEPLFSQLRTTEQLGTSSSLFLHSLDSCYTYIHLSRLHTSTPVSYVTPPGYMVHCAYRRIAGQVDAMEVLVQSALRDPVYLLQRVLDFAARFTVRPPSLSLFLLVTNTHSLSLVSDGQP